MRRLIAWATIYSASAAFQKLIGFVVFVWLARVMPVSDYARVGLLYAVQTGIITFALAGVLESVVGFLRDHQAPTDRQGLYAAADRAFGAMTASATAICVVLVFSTNSRAVAGLPLVWVVGSSVLLAFSSYQAQLVRLEEKHGAAVLFNTVPPLAAFVAGVGVFLYRKSVDAFFLGSFVGTALATAAVSPFRQRTIRYAPPRVTSSLLLATGAPFVVVAVLGWLSGYGQNYVVNMFFAPLEVARFTFALTVSSIMQLVATALNQVWSPRFYQLTHQEQLEAVEARNLRFFRLQAIALGIVGAACVIGFAAARRMIGGNLVQYGSMRWELTSLTAAYVLLPPWWHCQNYFLAYGKGPELMRNVIATSIIGISIWIFLMWRLGPLGIYLGFFVQMLVRMEGAVILSRRHWPLRLAWDGVAAGILVVFVGAMISTL